MNVMNVSATLPSKSLGKWRATKIVAEGEGGAFCLKPRHIDWLGVLGVGITELELESGEELFIAHDVGILVKRDFDVMISVRRGLVSHDLSELQETVEHVFKFVDEQELKARAAASKLEIGFVRRFLELKEEIGGG